MERESARELYAITTKTTIPLNEYDDFKDFFFFGIVCKCTAWEIAITTTKNIFLIIINIHTTQLEKHILACENTMMITMMMMMMTLAINKQWQHCL